MKTHILVGLLIFYALKSSAQLKNLNNYNELISFQKDIQSKTKMAVVWGYFDSWGKYPNIHKQECKGKLDPKEYLKITTCLRFKLFLDSTVYYLPIKQALQIPANYMPGDLIKLKIKLYKNCASVDKKIIFLIEDIL